MKIIANKDGTYWKATRCDYRRKGKTKRRFILRECYRNGSEVEPVVVRFASHVEGMS